MSCEISLLQFAAGISRKVLGVNRLGADMGWRAFEGAEMRGGDASFRVPKNGQCL